MLTFARSAFWLFLIVGLFLLCMIWLSDCFHHVNCLPSKYTLRQGLIKFSVFFAARHVIFWSRNNAEFIYSAPFLLMPVICNFCLWFVIYYACDMPIALRIVLALFIAHVFPVRFRSFQQISEDSIHSTQEVEDQVKWNLSNWAWCGCCCLDTYFIHGRFKPWARANGRLFAKTK